MSSSQRPAAILIAAILVAGCGGQAQRAQPGQTPVAQIVPTAAASASAAPSPSPSSRPTPPPTTPAPPPFTYSHVFVIVMENRSYAQAISGGYTSKLARQYGYATNYHGVSHPSLPNYLAMTSGSTHGITDDGYYVLPAGDLGTQLTSARISWRAYMEGMTGACTTSTYPYAVKHDPFAYYGGRCPSNVVPFTHFAGDMKGTVPRFVWITPDMCHDGHDCSTATADAWLSKTVPVILNSTAWKQGGVLFVTWDEGEDSANSVLTIVVHPRPKVKTSRIAYNHYNLLATIEGVFGLKRLGAAATAARMSDLMAIS
jgi:hypothetical protein